MVRRRGRGGAGSVRRLNPRIDSLYENARPANVVDELLAERRAEAAREAAE